MKPTIKASLIAAAISLFPFGAYAAGLGQISVQSYYGEPLNAEIQLNATPQELQSLSARVAPPDAFLQANIPYASFVPNVKIAVENRGGRSVLRLTSTGPVNEAVASLIIQLNWDDGRLSRTYNFLLDPADLTIRSPAPVEPVVTRPAPVEVPPVVAPEPVVQAPPPPVAEPEPVVTAAPEEAPPYIPYTEPESAPSAEVAPAPVVEPPAPPPPPVARPAPVAPPPFVAPSPVYPEGDHRVVQGDTLGDIASSRISADVSLEQMMMALYRANPSAFIDKNINRIKTGAILKMPSESETRSITGGQARREVRVHARNFNAWRKELAEGTASAPARQVDSGGGVTGTIGTVQQDVRQDRDRIEVGSTASVGGDTERLRKLQEDFAATESRRKEAEDRVRALEKINEDARKLIALRAKEVADLEAQLKAKVQTPAEPAAPVPPQVVEPPPPPVQAVEPPPPPVVEPPPAPEPPAEPVTAPPEQKPAADATETAQSQPVEGEEVPEDPLASVLSSMTDTQNLGIAATIILLLGCFLGFRSWQRKRSDVGLDTLSQDATSMFPSEATSIFGDNGGQSVDTSGGSSVIHTDFSQTGLSIDTNEGVDPVAEADVYMAYGRDSQAEEILNDALKADPKRGAIYVKLLEIYAQRQDLAQFGATASELFSRTQGQGRDWDKAAQMGHRLDPNNPLYSGQSPDRGNGEASKLPGLEPGIEEHTKLDMGAPASGKALADLDFGTGSSPDAGHLKETMVRGDMLATSVAGNVGRRSETSIGVDFQLDEEAPPKAGKSIDFDLGQSPAKPGKPVASRQPRQSAASRQPRAGDATSPIEFDLPPQKPRKNGDMTATVVLPSVQGGDDHSDDVMLDLEKTSFDPNALDFDLDIDEPEPAPKPAPSPMSSRGVRQPIVAEALDGDAGEVDTKLELARAYEDMGDTEGALELLREVVAEGSAAQKAQAQALINKLA